ncbi:transcription initiation factor TFIID subunit 3-like [Myzus persicae]|uniref:transcription initiation factor TFIID subunit 3-like n=1 Tax=Myzus persicae TaxID=13164 RepID=UPI000B93266D|nr:transcription initiation factor TFIID subunit 3-like [Myzus persicae]
MDEFVRQTLTISVAQICNNIGWHSITDSSMKIMTDILHHYISDLSITSKKYAEHAYNNVPDIEDVEKAFRQKSVSLNELRRYIKSTGPVKFPHNLPLLNISGKNVLNTLKPGSREMLTRPIHIHEHLPTLYTEQIEEEQATDTEQSQNIITNTKQEPEEVILHKRLREISSVVMTSGGFLSPSREGRLADSKLLPFPEIKIDKPLETSKLSVILPNLAKEPSPRILKNKKKTKSGSKKKLKASKTQKLLLQQKEQKKEVLKNKKEEKMLIPEPPSIIPEPVIEDIIDIVNVTEKVQVPKKVILTSHTNKVKMEEVLPKFSFFGPLPPGPGLIPTTFPQIINPVLNVPDIIEKPTSPVLQVENDDINRKEQKKKKKDKKKGKKEKKKQKDKVKEKVKEKEKEKEKKKDKLKSTNKVPKLKFRFGSRLETTTKVLPVEKSPETNITLVSEPEPMEVEVDIESKSDISIDILHDIDSPPKVPIQKLKTKIVAKPIQPAVIPPPVNETPPPAFYFDEAGNQVWICPMCTKPDDGSPMIGCDGCDVWYHWVCVGIQCPPDCAVWFCPRCLAKRAQQPKGKRGRPRKNK